MSIFKRPGSPFWQCEIVVNGTRAVRSTGTDNKREAKAFEAALRASLTAKAGRPAKRELTLDQACGRWWLEKGQALASSRDEARHLRRIVEMLGTKIAVSEVTNEHVTQVVAAITAGGGGPAAVNRCLATFRQVLRRGRRLWGLDVQDIHWPDHFKRESKGRTRWLTQAEAVRLLDASPEPLRLAIEWSLLTGCRQSETYRITWADVDLDRGQVAIRKAKTGARVVWLTDESRAVLLRCPRDRATVFDKRNVRKLFEGVLAKEKIADFHWHDLRHTHASWMRQAGAPLEVVQRSLGHASITTTQRYAHVDDGEMRNALAALPSLSPSVGGNVVNLSRRRR
jgi:integrase